MDYKDGNGEKYLVKINENLSNQMIVKDAGCSDRCVVKIHVTDATRRYKM